MNLKIKQYVLKDKDTEIVWSGLHQELGERLRKIREDTPAKFRWHTKKFSPMSRRELANHINGKLADGDYPITEAIIARIENKQNKFGGYFDRVRQVAEGLRLDLHLTRTKQ